MNQSHHHTLFHLLANPNDLSTTIPNTNFAYTTSSSSLNEKRAVEWEERINYNRKIISILDHHPHLLGLVENGETLMLPIHYACKQGNFELVSYMIRKGSRIDDKDNRERTPLYYAIQSQNLELIKFLYEHDKVTKIVPDAFFHAAEMRLLEVVKYMMEYHIEYLERRKRAYLKKHSRLADDWSTFIAREPQPLHNYRDSIGNSILHVASNSGATSIVEYLIDTWQMDIEEMSALGFTPLFNAVSEGYEETARVLLEKYDAQTNWRTNVGRSLLHYACDRGNINMIQWFIERGLDPNEKEKASEWTCLHFAAAKNRYVAVKYLLKLPNIDVKAIDRSKKRALAYGTDERIKCLLLEAFLANANFSEKLDYYYILFVRKFSRRLIVLSLAIIFIWLFRKIFT